MCLIKECICWWKESWCHQNALYNNKNLEYLFLSPELLLSGNKIYRDWIFVWLIPRTFLNSVYQPTNTHSIKWNTNHDKYETPLGWHPSAETCRNLIHIMIVFYFIECIYLVAILQSEICSWLVHFGPPYIGPIACSGTNDLSSVCRLVGMTIWTTEVFVRTTNDF